MPTVIIKDPYEGKYEVEIDDSTPQEAIDELIAFTDGNRKEIQSAERKERRHALSAWTTLYTKETIMPTRILPKLSLCRTKAMSSGWTSISPFLPKRREDGAVCVLQGLPIKKSPR